MPPRDDLYTPRAATRYHAALDTLYARTGGHVIKPGLQRTQALLAALGDPHTRFAAFHVAGTNGKGSTCVTLDALLRHRGYTVGRYTSPHLIDFRERILVNGVPIPEDTVVEFLDRVMPIAIQLEATFFEITTALAFSYFADMRCDVAVIETGLGGRLDSTNVITPVVATVTNISMDHAEYLGDTLDKIADEKAGIFKSGRPAVICEPRADLARRLAERAQEQGASSIHVVRNDWRAWSVTSGPRGTTFTASTPLGQIRLGTPLQGEHQARNTLGALATLNAAGAAYMVPPAEVTDALKTVHLPGRFQRVGEWVFDVAHNLASAQVLVETLRSTPIPRPVTAVVAVLKDKDWKGVIDALSEEVDTFIITQPDSAPEPRTWDPMEAGLYASKRNVFVILEVTLEGALLRAQRIAGTKLITGSFYTVGDAMARLGIDPMTPSDIRNTREHPIPPGLGA